MTRTGSLFTGGPLQRVLGNFGTATGPGATGKAMSRAAYSPTAATRDGCPPEAMERGTENSRHSIADLEDWRGELSELQYADKSHVRRCATHGPTHSRFLPPALALLQFSVGQRCLTMELSGAAPP